MHLLSNVHGLGKAVAAAAGKVANGARHTTTPNEEGHTATSDTINCSHATHPSCMTTPKTIVPTSPEVKPTTPPL